MAVEYFRRLLWLESSRVGIGRNLVNVPDCINVADGGLDAFIPDAEASNDEVIPQGTSGFQIKSSDIDMSDCKYELHEGKDPSKPLKPRIKSLLNHNGTYVLVLFADLTIPKQDVRRNAIIDELIRNGYKNIQNRVRLYSINQLMNFGDRYPSLIRWLKPQIGIAYTHDEWSKFRDIRIPRKFVKDDERKKFIDTISDTLRNPRTTTSIFRVTGLPGLGKKRLVFESLNDPLLSKQVLCLNADSIKHSILLPSLITNDVNAILVVDECSPVEHEQLVRTFADLGPRISLITISQEIADSPPPTEQLKMSPLSEENMFKLIRDEIPGLPPFVIDRLVTFCFGYPKIASFLSESFKLHPLQGFVYPNFTGTALIDKLIYGNALTPTSDVKKVLMGLSLFDGVGHAGEALDEAKLISKFVDVKWSDFELIVKEQKKRGIIQGNSMIYVTPPPLKIHLINEWWKTYGNDPSLVNSLFNEMPYRFRESMISRFVSNLSYATSVKSGKDLVNELLKKNGVFSDFDFLTSNWGSRLFLSLVEADPKASLECLDQTLASLNEDQISKVESYALFPIVEALQKIAVRRDHFVHAAELLLKLAASQIEFYGKHIQEKFADMFLPAPLIGSYESSPSERIPVLMKAISSDNPNIRKLSLLAFEKALEARHFMIIRTDLDRNPSYIPKIWNYQSREEVIEYYIKTWKFLSAELVDSVYDIKKEVSQILLKFARGILSLDETAGYEVLSTLSTMSKVDWIEKSEVLEEVLSILHYDKNRMSANLIKDFNELRVELEGSGFHNRLVRFVKYDFSHDYFHDTEGKYSRDWLDTSLKELSTEIINDSALLDSEYEWLSSYAAKRSYDFGQILGLSDNKFTLLPRLLSMHRRIRKEDISPGFLGGYLKALYEHNKEQWEENIKLLSEDEYLRKFVPGLVYLSGMTDTAACVVLSTIQNGYASEIEFFRYKYASVINRISEPIFQDWIGYLVKSSSDDLVSLCIEFVYFYYMYRSVIPLPKKLILEILLHPLFWTNPNKREMNRIPVEHWSNIAGELVKQFPETLEILSNRLFEHFGNESSVASSDNDGIGRLLATAISKNPDQWTYKILDQLEPPLDRKAFRFLSWFRGDSLFEKFPLSSIINSDALWAWIDQKKVDRAKHIANYLPPELFHSENRFCIAREFLSRYGADEEISKAFVSNYFTETFTGSAVEHYTAKRQTLSKLKENESDDNVLRVLSKCMDDLDREISFFSEYGIN